MASDARSRRRWRAWAIAAAAVGHLIFLAALIGSVRHERLPEAPVIDVQLARSPEDRERQPAAATAADSTVAESMRATRSAPFAPPPPFSAPALPNTATPTPPPSVASPAPDDAQARVSAALRAASAGCRETGLTAEQRERCLEREGGRARAEGAEIGREERRSRHIDQAMRAPKPNATALVRAPGDDPRNHPLGGPPPVMAGVTIPFGKPPKAITPIPPSTLRGDDDALRPKPRAD